jgi:aerobic-type carbon monoxide dehydrogenase small subunit (CoxS/CutS family)
LDIDLVLNGRPARLVAAAAVRLSAALRDHGLTGLKEGCLEGECGACTVLLDGAPVCACLMLAGQAAGRQVVTVEGLAAAPGGLSDLQRAFVEEGAVQCGYCTPGMLMAAEGLLASDPAPDEPAIRRAIAGNLCRCTGYAAIVKAVARTAAGRLAARP